MHHTPPTPTNSPVTEYNLSLVNEDAPLHVVRATMSDSILPNMSAEFKNEGPKVNAIFKLKS